MFLLDSAVGVSAGKVPPRSTKKLGNNRATFRVGSLQERLFCPIDPPRLRLRRSQEVVPAQRDPLNASDDLLLHADNVSSHVSSQALQNKHIDLK